MTIEPFVVEVIPGAPMAPDIDAIMDADATGAGLACLIAAMLERAGATGAAAAVQGHLWIGDRWHAEILFGAHRRAEEAAFDQGHHLLFRLTEQIARWLGNELPEPVIRSFNDLRTSSPAALLAYAASWGHAEPATARRALIRAFELDPAFVAPRIVLARQLVQSSGSAAQAAALLAGVAIEDAAAASALGLALWEQGEPAAAQALLQQAVHLEPEESPGWAIGAAALAALLARSVPAGQATHEALDEALLLATRSTQLASDDYRCWAALGDIYRARADFDQAGFYYGFALRLEPNAPTVLKDASACWLMARQPQQALPLIERSLVLAPLDAENHGNLAFVRDALGESEAALAAARRAAELAPGDARFRILHGDLAHKAGHRDEALTAWARAAEIEPGMIIDPEGGNVGLPEAAPA